MLDVNHLIQAGGLLLIAAVVFAESGMMVGFFLPGDTLLLSAGIFAAQGKLSLGLTIAVIAAAAIAGDNVGYHIGKYAGPRLFRKKDSLVFRHDYLMRAEQFYEKYGSKAMLLAHFVPVVRTFAPIVAGIGRMPYAKFVIFDGIGDIVWATAVTLIGYFFGSRVPNLDHYILPVFIGVIVLTFGPTIYHVLRDPKFRAALTHKRSTSSDKEE
jgi:membrane-associated protein